MDIALAIMLGLGLSAACGFRVFVPLLVLGGAARLGAASLAPSLAWMGTDEAIVCFAVATVLEIVAYKVPWLDHALDTVATPAAVCAGAIVSASQIGAITSVSPLLQWACAIIAGGGVAGIVQAGTVTTRAVSTVGTGGLANPLISAAQSVLSVFVSVLSVALPILGGLFALMAVGGCVWIVVKLRRRSRARAARLAAARTATPPAISRAA
ncbi:MAG TPA: DUF4126 domain-containing protein [Phycisphaerales bacterium]|nr:DUF4126 domain-containing protein [Phycisphaerales bacterium]